jgi:RHS repeat-associated protein
LVSVPGITGTAGGVSQITYHSNGLVNQVPHANGILFTQQNDPNGIARPAGMTAGSLWTSGTYSYDGAGNAKAVGIQSFVYDNLGRLVTGNLPGSTQSYSFDAYGNIQSITTDGSVLSTGTSSVTNRLNSAAYDAAGNLTSWSGNTYEYDPFDNLAHYRSGAQDWYYIYGPDDERFWSYRTSDAASQWALRDLNGKVLRFYEAHLGWGNFEDYVYRDGLLLAGIFYDGQQRHFDVDHLGSVRLITDAFGNQTGFHRYYPFGKEHTGLQQAERMKFTGHERDLADWAGDGDDLDYMHARHYSPVTGRFLSLDPLGGNPHAPQSWNRCAYVLGNPMKNIDPSGMNPVVGVNNRTPPPVGMTVYDIGFGEAWTVLSSGGWVRITQQPYPGNSFSIRHPTGFGGSLFGDEGTREIARRVVRTAGPPVNWVGIYLVAFFTAQPFIAPLEAGGMTFAETLHGAERLSDASRLTTLEAVAAERGAQVVLEQGDGAVVYVQEIAPGKFNVVVKGVDGLITNFKHLSARSLARLATRYGWH